MCLYGACFIYEWDICLSRVMGLVCVCVQVIPACVVGVCCACVCGISVVYDCICVIVVVCVCVLVQNNTQTSMTKGFWEDNSPLTPISQVLPVFRSFSLTLFFAAWP